MHCNTCLSERAKNARILPIVCSKRFYCNLGEFKEYKLQNMHLLFKGRVS
jgi:hypothetical protein